jgi:hypothetical protein
MPPLHAPQLPPPHRRRIAAAARSRRRWPRFASRASGNLCTHASRRAMTVRARAAACAQAERRLLDVGVDLVLETEVAHVHADSLRLVPRRADAPSGGAAPSGDGGASAGAESSSGGETAGGSRAAAAARNVAEATAGGYELPVDLTLWTAGVEPSSAVQALGLPVDERGRIRVDATMAVDAAPGLFALGDATAVPDASGTAAPSTAQAAVQQADYAAWNIRASLRGDTPMSFRYLALGEMLSLGDDAAAISALGQLVRLSGPLASVGRRAVYAARMPTPRQAAKVGLSWAVDAAFGAARRLAKPPTGGRGGAL